MTPLPTYLPQDRLRALARNATLPDRTRGAALFADISGFTPLTEKLRDTLGPRRGAEELSRQLEAVFTALIAEVEKYGGSVIGFAGDAMTCWFEGEAEGRKQKASDTACYLPPSAFAVACALALQTAMTAFPQLALKVAIASGPARRLAVGDPAIQLFDVLAGETLARMAHGEHLAQQGEVLVDETTARALGDALNISEWRPAENGERFAVATAFAASEPPPPIALPALPPEPLRAWVPAWLYARENSGQRAFLNEFRTVTFLFLRFTGIDYEAEAALAQLNTYLGWLQNVAQQAEGYLCAPIIGDKGSYLFIAFGAPTAHEDDPRRAVRLALTLRAPPAACAFITVTQMGLATGVVWTGVSGGATRKAYDFMGDDVNLAARLMQAAAPGEILVSGRVQAKVAGEFTFGPERRLQLKGKTGAIPTFPLLAEPQQVGWRLPEPQYYLPLAGRQAELQIITEKLELTRRAQPQIIGIVGEAGVGKSRLVAEALERAQRAGLTVYGGACQSDGVNTPYLVWKTIWRAFFQLDPTTPPATQIQTLTATLHRLAPQRLAALPLLGPLLNLPLPDNDFTRTLEPKYRQSALRALLEDCLRTALQTQALLLIIEDLHWIDALSHDLLDELARAFTAVPLCLVMVYRPPQLARIAAPRLETLPHFTKIVLTELDAAAAAQLIRAKLAAFSATLPATMEQRLLAQAQGNPFYLEELLNYLHDRGFNQLTTAAPLELPDSLHNLILSRIDRLQEREKVTLKVASIIGRWFRVDWLSGYYPELGTLDQIKADLTELARLDITPLDTPEPELAYLFKHIITHEVTYASLPFAVRAQLHEQLAQYLEGRRAGPLPALETIAFHYGRSNNLAKQREYYQKAADAAQAVSAFITAVEHLTRLQDLIPAADPAQCALALKLADAHYRLGDYPAMRGAIAQAQAIATSAADHAAALALLGEMSSLLGDYAAAQKILAEAVPLARTSGDRLTLCRALYALGDVNWRLGKLEAAKAVLNESLTLARALGNLARELFVLNRLGVVARQQGALAEAERLMHEIHTRAVAAGNRERAMNALNNLGVVAYERKAYPAARAYYQQALALAREIGAQDMIALALINLADTDIQLGQRTTARAGLQEGLALALRLGATPWAVLAVKNFALLAHANGQTAHALALCGLARHQPAWRSDFQHELDTALAEWTLDPVVVEAGMQAGAALDWEATVKELLKG